jgi:hypothetical protein
MLITMTVMAQGAVATDGSCPSDQTDHMTITGSVLLAIFGMLTLVMMLLILAQLLLLILDAGNNRPHRHTYVASDAYRVYHPIVDMFRHMSVQCTRLSHHIVDPTICAARRIIQTATAYHRSPSQHPGRRTVSRRKLRTLRGAHHRSLRAVSVMRCSPQFSGEGVPIGDYPSYNLPNTEYLTETDADGNVTTYIQPAPVGPKNCWSTTDT